MRSMNQIASHPFHIVTRLVLVLVALFGASAQCVLRLAAMRGRVRARFARVLAHHVQRGGAMINAGEDDAATERRVALMEWIARSPWKVLRHVCRQARGHLRFSAAANAAPPSFAPPRLTCAALAEGIGALAPEPDT